MKRQQPDETAMVFRGLGLAVLLLCLACEKPRRTEFWNHEALAMEGPIETSELPTAIDAELLSHTDIVPHMEGPIVAGRNNVYCATMKLAWEEFDLRARLADSEMARAIDRVKFSRSDLDPESHLLLLGSGDDIRRKVNHAPHMRDFDFLDEEVTEEFALAYLHKSLPFREHFDRLPEPIEFRTESRKSLVSGYGIESFEKNGIRDTILRKQIVIEDYRNEQDFVLRLNTILSSDQIVLAKVRPARTLGETVDQVQARVRKSRKRNNGRSQLQDGESVAVPIISVGVRKHFDDLRWANRSPDGENRISAVQMIQFRLDEKGAKLKSYFGYESIGEEETPRRFIFDGPFLIYLVQENSQNPYFAAWIENDELLESR